MLYATMWIAFFLTIFKDPVFGLYYLAPLIPIQTIRYRLNEYPLGQSLLLLMFIGIVLGLARKRQWIPRTPWTPLLIIYVAFTFVSLCLGSLYLQQSPLALWGSPRMGEWRDYITMIGLLFVTAATVRTRKQIVVLLVLMCIGGYALDKSFWSTVSDRDFSSYSDDLRDEGAMGYAGVNGLAAFEAEFAILLLVLSHFEKRLRWKLGYLSLAIFSVVCLTYSLSRAGYAAFALGFVFIGIVKDRKLLILMAIFAVTWTAIVPNAVRERVTMTQQEDGELDHSSQTRVALWTDSLELFRESPIVGTGFGTYAYMGRIGIYRDTHNVFAKVLAETGVVGITLFLVLVGSLWSVGMGLFRKTEDPLFSALGLGLAGWIVCALAANFFGDRWTFLQVNGYMWILAGLVARARLIEEEGDEDAEDENEEEEAEGEMSESPAFLLAPV